MVQQALERGDAFQHIKRVADSETPLDGVWMTN